MDRLFEHTIEAMGTPVATNSAIENKSLPLLIACFKYGDVVIDLEPDDFDSRGFKMDLCGGTEVRRYWRKSSNKITSRVGQITVFRNDVKEQIVKTGSSKVISVFIKKSELAKWTEPDGSPVPERLFYSPDWELERCAQRSLVALREGDGDDPLLLSSIAGRILSRLPDLAITDVSAGMGLSPHQARRVNALIMSRITEPVSVSPSLEELAAEAGLSLYHFAREFRRTFGMAPYAYTLRKRLEFARAMLVSSDVLVAEVARSSGFASHANFTEKFRREMGVTPSAFRQAVRS